MKARIIAFASLLTVVGCATPPKGQPTLAPMVSRDMTSQNVGGAAEVKKGRPIFVKAYAYPTVLPSGDVWAGGWILVNVGREDVALESLLPKP